MTRPPGSKHNPDVSTETGNPGELSDTPRDSPRDHALKYVALLTTALINFGDAVEIYLPSVITQPVSCELSLTRDEEHLLALALYVTLSVTTILTIPFSDRFGRRTILLVAMYLAIGVTVLCAVVPNYTSLLMSRVLLGFSIAINMSTVSVYMSEIAMDRVFYVRSITVLGMMYNVGGGWCGVLGYLFLERLGWRYFVLVASVPFSIIPLILLHVYLPETKDREDGDESGIQVGDMDANEMTHLKGTPTSRPFLSILSRTVKICLFSVTRGTPYFGAILLLPAILRTHNLEEVGSVGQVGGCRAIHDIQFLLISLFFGPCHFLGRMRAYAAWGRLSCAAILTITAAIDLIAGITMATMSRDLVIVMVGIAVVQTVSCASANETYILGNDRDFYTSKWLALGSGHYVGTISLVIAGSGILSEVVTGYQCVLNVHVGFYLANVVTTALFFIKE